MRCEAGDQHHSGVYGLVATARSLRDTDTSDCFDNREKLFAYAAERSVPGSLRMVLPAVR